MLHYRHPLHFLVAVDAGNHDVGAGCLVQVNLLPQALGSTLVERLALDWLEVAESIMRLHLYVAKCHWAAQVLVLALELHRVQFLLDFLLY